MTQTVTRATKRLLNLLRDSSCFAVQLHLAHSLPSLSFTISEGKGRETTNARTQTTSLFVYRGNKECAYVLTRILPGLSVNCNYAPLQNTLYLLYYLLLKNFCLENDSIKLNGFKRCFLSYSSSFQIQTERARISLKAQTPCKP